MDKKIEHKGLLVLTKLNIKQFIKADGEQSTIDLIAALISDRACEDEEYAMQEVVKHV